MEGIKVERYDTDVLIIGGGTAGCYSAITLARQSTKKILVVEKAHVKRSGCLAAGVNALNAYITEGQTPEDYVNYAKEDAHGIVREDLLLSMAKRLNGVTKDLEEMGLVILKNESGGYASRGKRNIKINGENIKPLLAKKMEQYQQVEVWNQVSIIEFLVKEHKMIGAMGLDLEKGILYIIEATAVICATGGASGLYQPNHTGFSRHKMWYSPFNTGAGYAMGILAGAEMTTFEMRFIALRCKDTIAPTGTLALGVGAKQVNRLGEEYGKECGKSTSERVYTTTKEKREGRGPCYLKTTGINEEQNQDLKKAYLNMAPSQTLRWMERKKDPIEEDVEIEGTEPYIVGGHTASGYWVDTGRRTTVKGLYAVGDVGGGCPQKYVTGALVEGEIAVESVLKDIVELEKDQKKTKKEEREKIIDLKAEQTCIEIEQYLKRESSLFTWEDLEEAMQTVMDTYAGGMKEGYSYHEKQLDMGMEQIERIQGLVGGLKAVDMQEVWHIYELKERLTLCKSVILHLKARKETRWRGFSFHQDYPKRDDEHWMCYVNSIYQDGSLKIILRDLVTGGKTYEHSYT